VRAPGVISILVSDARSEPLQTAPRWSLFGLPWRSMPGRPVSVASAVLVFATSGLVALALVTAGVLFLVRRTATDEATRNATRVTQVVGQGLIAPALDDGLLRSDPAAIAQLDSVVRQHVLSSSIVRVKIWSNAGVVLYSDEPRLIGSRFVLGSDEIAAFQRDTAASEVANLDHPENEFERGWAKLLAVYLPVQTPGGSRLLFETYLPYSVISSSGNDIWREFLPVLIAGLAVLELIQLPLAWSLASRLKSQQDEREALLGRAIEASERERRLIASDLHDGPVQDLVAHSYRLAAVADRLEGEVPDDEVQAVRAASGQSRRTVRELRSMVVDLYPLGLRTAGLDAALEDLAAPLRSRGVEVLVAIAPDFRASDQVERLLYRAAREALRNVQQHADASNVCVGVTSTATRATLMVEDNGRGFQPAEREARRKRGHLGLDLLEGLVRDAGGSITVETERGQGTRVSLKVPMA
jgi:two-component system, NarL family, sensor kinase